MIEVELTNELVGKLVNSWILLNAGVALPDPVKMRRHLSTAPSVQVFRMMLVLRATVRSTSTSLIDSPYRSWSANSHSR